ncbi:hypothetical protein CB0940_07407 [Cercospora beticola]|uniref:Uncharacterized protein n=1 Tax=Cercospora beticola TaxID=122368 RepID=A0A2G5H822_CERBT|nr:hypothetical protein CB0940_07407 [Cercospora beticola]PIA88680.1 hypothetical protein CB0940_07407 [Cercospora beticola]WPB03354.1 hypothetical protein RHO25_007992 [Cercospora beticola]
MAPLWRTATAMLTAASFGTQAFAQEERASLKIEISTSEGILNGSTNGRIVLLFAPAGTDPLEDTDVTSSSDLFFGKNVYNFTTGDTVTLSGGSNNNTDFGVYGWPDVSLSDVPSGDYTIQALLNQYETVTRSDGSQVSVRFPCGDGAVPLAGPGSLTTSPTNVTVSGSDQIIQLNFDSVVPPIQFNGTEIGGCSQGNYEDTELLKHVKIRSDVLSTFWNRDIYVGANIRLPFGYDANDTNTRYPLLYEQSHWVAGDSDDSTFANTWNQGTIPGVNGTAGRPTPKLILVTIRHETPFYDDSYGVNTANIGPWGDAINDELIPEIDRLFNTIAAPYGRIQSGGSTGGWISIANVIFRPDLYAQENHWELTQGTSSRSFLQWDVWNAVFGAQGLNGYPLEPWDKVTGEIYPEAVEYWKPMDLSSYVTSNWDNEKNLGEVLRNRLFVYVGTWDNYFLNEGVMEFQKNVESKGGPGWANFTYIEKATHGGQYQRRDRWDFLELVVESSKNIAPDGKTPLPATDASARGNLWEEVVARGGHQAALDRQAAPTITTKVRAYGRRFAEANAGRWDPGVKLEAQWLINGQPTNDPRDTVSVGLNETLQYEPTIRKHNVTTFQLALEVTGTKRGYKTETRVSPSVELCA